MFDIGGTELLLIAVVALLVIGPKDLPRVLRVVGQYTGKARAMTRHLRSGFDEMMRQAELEEMEKKWAEYNRQVMAQTPTVPDYASPQASAPPATTTSDTAPATATVVDPAQTDAPQPEPPETVPSAIAPPETIADATAPATPPVADGPQRP